MANTSDPLAGSYYLESLTNEMERQALAYFEQIDALGGVEKAIDAGFFAREIGDASWRQQREIDEGRRWVVGVNAFQQENPEVPIQLVDPEVSRVQEERLQRVRRERDPERAEAALEGLRRAAKEGANTMPAFLECALAYCTLGEQMDVLREVYGVYQEPVLI
ncbi:MAG: methylmalonyl-CoA mutase family protein [Deinococcales bacterium]